MRKTAYHLGVFAFGMLSVGQMVPVLLGDESLGNPEKDFLILAKYPDSTRRVFR